MPTPPARAGGEFNDTQRAWAVCGFLLLAIAIIYGQTLRYALLDYDDRVFVTDNPHVAPGVTSSGIHWAFTSGPGGEWYPLAMLSHMVDCQLFGTAGWGHHLTNVLLHAATSLALFWVWWRFTGELWPSAFVATVFAVHPQHVESVAWVAERKDVLSGLLFVLTLGVYCDYVRRGRPSAWYGLLILVFALALLAKPMVVTLPAVLLLLDYWPLARIGAAEDKPAWTESVARPTVGRTIVEKLPLLAMAAAVSWTTLETHHTLPTMPSLPERLANAAVCLPTYIWQMLWPVGLAAFYPFPTGGPPEGKVVLAVLILIVASVAAVLWRRGLPYLFVGWFWFLGMLMPVLGVVKIGPLAMADRYVYLPGIGLSIAVAWGGARLAATAPGGQKLAAWAAGAAALGMIGLSTWQVGYWRDDFTLWTHTLACTADNGEAEIGLADALSRQNKVDEATMHYRRAMALGNEAAPYHNLGFMLAMHDRPDEAIGLFYQALEHDRDPDLTMRIYRNLTQMLLNQNRLQEAHETFVRIVKDDPESVPAHCCLALVLDREGKSAEARQQFELAVELDPNNANIRSDLAAIAFREGHVNEAIDQLQAAVKVDPSLVTARLNLAMIFATAGRPDEAASEFRQVLVLDPGNQTARDALARLKPAR